MLARFVLSLCQNHKKISNERMAVDNKLEKEKYGRKMSWPILRYYPGSFLEGLRKSTETPVRTEGLRVEIFESGTYRMCSWSANHSTSNIRLSLSEIITTRKRRKIHNEELHYLLTS